VRILELGKYYPPERGGIETLLQAWSEGFARLGGEVDCVVAHGPQTPGSRWRTLREVRAGVRVHRLASAGELFSVSLCPGYPFAARRFQADVIHAHFPNPLADVACVLAPRRTPVVVSWHSDIIRQRALLWAYQPLQRALLRRADRIVVATPNHLKYSAWLGPYRDKVRVIPFGLKLERFLTVAPDDAKVAELRRQARGRFILLNVGRLVGYKGQRYAISALAELPDCELWLVGKGPLEAELRRQAAELGVADRIRLFGDVVDDDLPQFYHACDVFVFPSITPNEAFGLVQVEAMAARKPVVACNLRSGVPYVCRHGETGLVVPPQNHQELAAAIRRLQGDMNYTKTLGTRGRERAQSEFAEAVMVRRYWELFGEMIAAKRA
jgi:rhamnosyl/mannosyltransferase